MRRLAAALLVVGLLSAFGSLIILAQKAERGTQQWTIKVENTYSREIRVIDTSGVCLYVTVGGGDNMIAAVPKSQLPQGTGCQ